MAKVQTIVGERIHISGPMKRHEIVRAVVNHFIDTEYWQKGPGIRFEYPVEDLSNAGALVIARPGKKKNFDFKVLIEPSYGLDKGQHEDIAHDLIEKARTAPSRFGDLWAAISDVYHCVESEADMVLASRPALNEPFGVGASSEVVVKVIKWLFIMEDIFYWDSEGRGFLYNFLNYSVQETDSTRLQKAMQDLGKWARPDTLKKYMSKCGLSWIHSKG